MTHFSYASPLVASPRKSRCPKLLCSDGLPPSASVRVLVLAGRGAACITNRALPSCAQSRHPITRGRRVAVHPAGTNASESSQGARAAAFCPGFSAN